MSFGLAEEAEYTQPNLDFHFFGPYTGIHNYKLRDYKVNPKQLDKTVEAVKQGRSKVTLPRNTLQSAIEEVASVLAEDGVRLRSLKLVQSERDGLDASIGSALCSAVCMDAVDGFPHLQCLISQWAKWRTDGMAAFAPAMLHAGSKNRLRVLVLEGLSTMSLECVQVLQEVLADSQCSLEVLKIHDMLGSLRQVPPRKPEVIQELYKINRLMADGIRCNRSIRYCHLGPCNLDLDAMLAWTEALSSNCSLVQLETSWILLSGSGLAPYNAMGECAARIVKENTSIKHLTLRYNMIPGRKSTPCRVSQLCEAVRQNQALRSLVIGPTGHPDFRGQPEEAARQCGRMLEAVLANPRIVFFWWQRALGTFHEDSTIPAMLPRLRAFNARRRRIGALLRHRVASQARHDAGLVWRAASEGRPLELARRLRLGVMAGGAERKLSVGGVMRDAMEAAIANGHDECGVLVRRSLAREVRRRAIYGLDVRVSGL